MNGFEQCIEVGLVPGVVIAADQNDPFTLQTLTDGARMSGARTRQTTGEVTQVKKQIVSTHHSIDLRDQPIIHVPDVGVTTTESIDGIGITEMSVGCHEDASGQIQVRPSGSRLKFSQPDSVTATMSSIRMPPIAAQYKPGSTVSTSPTTNAGALKSSNGGSWT